MRRLSFLILFVVAHPLCAQWKLLAPNAFSIPPDGQCGHITYHAGKIWAGYDSVVLVSSDQGSSWHRVPLDADVRALYWINFFDANIGLVIPEDNIPRVTTDGGHTWSMRASNAISLGETIFLGSPQKLAAWQGSRLQLSSDAGQSWSPTVLPAGFGPDLLLYKQSTNNFFLEGWTYASTDLPKGLAISSDGGMTWNLTGGQFSSDCWSFAIDSCSDSYIYVVNEECYMPDADNHGKLYCSKDGGNTFTANNLNTTSYYCGSIETGPGGTVFVQTQTSDGVLRSTDRGLTWESIGGPPGLKDSKLITAKDDNTLFALDRDGNIWGTWNCGGKPLTIADGINARTVALHSLFDQDTISRCDSLVQTLKFIRSGCNPPAVKAITITGANALAYSVNIVTDDSANISFHPQSDGMASAQLVIGYANGSSDTVILGAVASSSQPLSILSSDQSADTIGQTVHIPIAIHGLRVTHDIELVLHYDVRPDLIYNGSHALDGSLMDKPSEQWPSRSRLRVTGAVPDSTFGFADFLVYSTNAEEPHIWLDSATIVPMSCETALTPADSIAIHLTFRCENPILSQYLLTGNILFGIETIFPQPASDRISIFLSNKSGSLINVDMLDALGRRWFQGVVGENTLTIDIRSFPDGVYYLKANVGSRYTQIRRVVVAHGE